MYFDVLGAAAAPEAEAAEPAAPVRKTRTAAAPVAEAAPMVTAKPRSRKPALDQTALEMLAKAVAASADEDGRANLGRVGNHLAKQAPDFDARNYGFARLSELVEASGIVDVERTGDHPKVVMVSLKPLPSSN